MQTEAAADSRRLRRRSTAEATISRTRSLKRRYSEVWAEKLKDRATVELPEPVRAGWERYFYVRPDLDKSPEAPLLRKLLPIIQSAERSGRKDFACRDRQHGNKLRPSAHHPRALSSERELHALDENLQRCFERVRERDDWGRWHAKWVLRHPWKFASRTRPFYYTHRELPNSEAESEWEWLNDKLHGGDRQGWLMRHLLRQWGDSFSDWDDYGEPASDRRRMLAPDTEEVA